MWKKRQEDIKEKPPDREARRLELESFPREHKGESSNQCQNLKSDKDFFNQDEDSKGVFQLKEEPPDLPNSVSFRGKLLNPYTLQWTNLLYLCVGDQVLRSKLFEEGGYDEDMTSMIMDQLAQEESTPTGPAHMLEEATDPTEPATHGNMRRDFNPTGKLIQLSAALGNFTRYLASHGEPLPAEDNSYLAPEVTCLIYPYHPGNPPGEDLATHGDPIRTLEIYGSLTRPLEAHNNLLPAQENTHHDLKDNFPNLPPLGVITGGNFSFPDKATFIHSRNQFQRLFPSPLHNFTPPKNKETSHHEFNSILNQVSMISSLNKA